jgi:hypothetical protein
MTTEYDFKEVFDQYTVNDKLTTADIFHLYDTGVGCLEGNTGYHDSRHFTLWAFNNVTMEKRNLGRHDGIDTYTGVELKMVRVFADGSFFIRLQHCVNIDNYQCVRLSL